MGRKYCHISQSGQRGALLIGLVIAMVILSALGAGTVYFFSSSVMDPVFSNFAQRAYYAAESGMRYAVSKYRYTTPTMNKVQFIAYVNTGGGTTLTFPKNGQAILTAVDNMPLATADVPQSAANATAITLNTGDSLTLVDDTNTAKLPSANGFFQIDGVTGYFRYKERSGNILQKIYGPGMPVTVPAGAAITVPWEQVEITSKGYYPTAGILGMSRTVEYAWVLSGKGGGPSSDPVNPDFDPTQWHIDKTRTRQGITEYFGGPGGSWGSVVFDTAEDAIRVYSTQSAAQTRFILGYNKEFFYNEWLRQGNYLTYDVQTKIKTWNATEGLHLYNYNAGLAFRLWGDSANYTTLNASFARGTNVPFDLPNPQNSYIILWRDRQGQQRELLAYKPVTSADGVIVDADNPAVLFSESLAGAPYPTETDPLTLIFWSPDPATSWLPVQVTDSTNPEYSTHPDYATSGFIGGESGNKILTLKEAWPTPNMKCDLIFYHKADFAPSTSGIVELSVDGGTTWLGPVVSYGSNYSTSWAKVRINIDSYILGKESSSYPLPVKIRFKLSQSAETKTSSWSVDDVSIVTYENQQYLRDWSTMLVRIRELPAPSGPSTVFGANDRVNEIQIFYGTTTQHGNVDATPRTPLDTNRYANPRCVPTYDADGNLLPCIGNWPPYDFATLQSSPEFDKFTLVSDWTGWLNGAITNFPFTNSEDPNQPPCKFELAGSGDYENVSIIRTNCYVTTTYPANTNSEIGLTAYGAAVAGNVYFDDFGIGTGGSGEGGIGYINPIQQ